MSFNNRMGLGRYGRLGTLPNFDLSDPIMSSIAAQVAQAQSTSAAAAPYLTNPVVKGAVDGLEQQIGAVYSDLQRLIASYKAAASGIGDTTGGGTKPDVSRYQYPNGGIDYQAAVKTWRATPAGRLARPDPEDYRYPGGEGWLVGDTQRWQSAAQSAAIARQVDLASLLDQYNSKVPAAYKADQDLASAHAAAATASAQATSARTQTENAVAQQNAVVAQTNLAVTQKRAAAIAASIENPGPSPLMVAAVAIPVLGILAYAFTRKKGGGSVAGYRRRRRSRR